MGRGNIVRAWFLTTGTLGGPSAAFGLATGVRGLVPVRMPIAVLVLEHEGRSGEPGDVTLVDTGWSASQCRAPLRELGSSAVFLGVRAGDGDDAASQLRQKGVDPRRVKAIVATHLHVDHVGGLVDFPDAEVVTTEAELRSARDRGALHGFDVDALAKVGRWSIARLDGPSRFEMPASADLGDGMVLVDLRGHTAGSMGVAVTVGDRAIVHLGDAAYTLGEARRGEQSPLARRTTLDLERQRVTYRAIARLLERRDATVLTSHDPESWRAVENRVFSA